MLAHLQHLEPAVMPPRSPLRLVALTALPPASTATLAAAYPPETLPTSNQMSTSFVPDRWLARTFVTVGAASSASANTAATTTAIARNIVSSSRHLLR
jgi:hypothetical protein